jgi:hypothetical protein
MGNIAEEARRRLELADDVRAQVDGAYRGMRQLYDAEHEARLRAESERDEARRDWRELVASGQTQEIHEAQELHEARRERDEARQERDAMRGRLADLERACGALSAIRLPLRPALDDLFGFYLVREGEPDGPDLRVAFLDWVSDEMQVKSSYCAPDSERVDP